MSDGPTGPPVPATRRGRTLAVAAPVLTCLWLWPPATVAAGAPTPGNTLPCSITLTALDATNHMLFRTVATAPVAGGLLATPLHTLERGGTRWERLVVEEDENGDGAPEVDVIMALDPPGNLALLYAPGLERCAATDTISSSSSGDQVAPGASIRVLRERLGFRPGVVGGRVERTLELPDGRLLVLARLLDARGADPGLMFDAAGNFLGATAPAVPGTDPAMTVAIMPLHRPERHHERPPRSAIDSRPAPSFATTVPGMLAQALVFASSGKGDEALRRLDQAIDGAGVSAPLLIERGVLHFSAGQVAPAIDDFSRAVQADPSSRMAHHNLGIALGTAGRYADAASSLARARDLAPDHASTRFQLALALKAASLGQEARSECDQLQRIDPVLGSELRLLLGY